MLWKLKSEVIVNEIVNKILISTIYTQGLVSYMFSLTIKIVYHNICLFIFTPCLNLTQLKG